MLRATDDGVMRAAGFVLPDAVGGGQLVCAAKGLIK